MTEQWNRSGMPRRRFLTIAGGAIAGAGILAACGDDDDSSSSETTGAADTTGTTSAPADGTTGTTAAPVTDLEPDGDLVYFNYAEYLDPEAIASFESEYGVSVNQNFYDTYDSMFARMQQESYDVVFPNGEWVSRLASANLLTPVNLAELSNISNVAPAFIDPWYDPDGTMSAPYNFYKSGLLVRDTDLQGVDVTSWADMGDPALSGLVFMFDDIQAGMQLGLQLAGRDINSVDDADIAAAVEELIALKGNLGGFVGDFNAPLISGEGSVTYSYNGAAAQVRGQVSDPDDIKWVNPAPGPIVYNDAMIIPSNAEHPNTARLFINHMLNPEVSSQNVLFTGYPTCTISGIETFNAEIAAVDPAASITVEELQEATEAGLLSQDIGEEGRAKWDAAWTEVKLA